jgi:hypothetical protein
MDTISKHVEQPESPRTRFQYKTNTRTTPQSHHHPRKEALESCGEEFYAENLPAGA